MRTAIVSLLAVAAMVISTRPADALPPRYFSNNGGYSDPNVVPYYSDYSGYAYPTYSYPTYYYPGYSYPAYSYPAYSYPNGGTARGTGYTGPSSRGGVMRPAPMSWRYGGYRNWDGRP